MPILLETLLLEDHKIGQTSTDTGALIPISDFRIEALNEFNLVFHSSSDGDSESFSGPEITILYPSEQGDILGAIIPLVLGEYQTFQVAPFADTFSLSVKVPFWLPDVRIQIWRGMPLSDLSPVQNKITNQRRKTPIRTSVTASNSPVSIVAARSGRTGLDMFNESDATLYGRFSSVSTPATVTDKDFIVPPRKLYEFPGEPPDLAINAIWVGDVTNGKVLVVEYTE